MAFHWLLIWFLCLLFVSFDLNCIISSSFHTLSLYFDLFHPDRPPFFFCSPSFLNIFCACIFFIFHVDLVLFYHYHHQPSSSLSSLLSSFYLSFCLPVTVSIISSQSFVTGNDMGHEQLVRLLVTTGRIVSS